MTIIKDVHSFGSLFSLISWLLEYSLLHKILWYFSSLQGWYRINTSPMAYNIIILFYNPLLDSPWHASLIVIEFFPLTIFQHVILFTIDNSIISENFIFAPPPCLACNHDFIFCIWYFVTSYSRLLSLQKPLYISIL